MPKEIITSRLNCRNCKCKCCEGSLYDRISGRKYIILPKKITKISTDGIQLVRVSRTRWKCRFFKKGRCSIYKNRPWLCEKWFCRDHPKKCSTDINSVQQNSILGFLVNPGRRL